MERENTSWIDETGGEFADQTLLQRFMEDAPTAPRGTIKKVEEVSSFCGSQAFQDLELGSVRFPSTETYLDDRTAEGCRSDRQRRPGPISVRHQYLELNKPRFPVSDMHQAKDQDTIACATKPVHLAPRQNADRRVIFHTDLNPWGAMALISTASKNESLKIYGMIHRHLKFKSLIRVRNVGTKQFPFYDLEFDLPYFVWRTTPLSMKPDDAKLRGRDKPLRIVEDLSFLSNSRPSPASTFAIDSLCQGHTSVLISTIDVRRYTAYALVDTYFDDEKNRESAKDYFAIPDSDSDWGEDDDADDEDSYADRDFLNTDPLTRGAFDANASCQDPWTYFCATFRARMEVVEGEWNIVAENAKEKIQGYIYSSPLGHRRFPSIASEEHCAWIRSTNAVLGKLLEPLEELIEEWKQFQPHEIFDTGVVDQDLSAISQSFQALEKCVGKLKRLQNDCNRFHKGITLYMTEEAHRGSKFLTRLTHITLTLTTLMILVHAPLSTSSGIYSMPAEALPHFLGPTKLSFLALAGALAVIVFFSFPLDTFSSLGYSPVANLFSA